MQNSSPDVSDTLKTKEGLESTARFMRCQAARRIGPHCGVDGCQQEWIFVAKRSGASSLKNPTAASYVVAMAKGVNLYS